MIALGLPWFAVLCGTLVKGLCVGRSPCDLLLCLLVHYTSPLCRGSCVLPLVLPLGTLVASVLSIWLV